MRRWVLVVAAMLAFAPAWGQEVPYNVEITGIEDDDLKDAVGAQSRLLSLKDEPPASVVALQRRADDDAKRIAEVLRAEGYYEGRVDTRLDETGTPIAVTVAVAPGPEFTLTAFDIALDTPPGFPRPEPVPLDRLDIELGGRARAKPVLDAQAKLLRALAEQGYPLAKVSDRRVVVDHPSRTMRVEMDVDTGPRARFGPVTVEGLSRLDPQFVLNRLPWREGEPFDVAQMEKLRKLLVTSGLFSSVKLATAQQAGEDGWLPLTITLAERDRRSVGFSATWSSAEGFGGEAFWEDRDIAGGAERVRLSLVVSEIRKAVDLTFRAPDFGRPDQDLVTSATVEERRTAAFVTQTAGVQGGFEWRVSDEWRVSAAGAVERTREEENLKIRQFTLVSVPMEARRDTSDDLLDPTRGNRLLLALRPFPEELGSSLGFTRGEVRDSQYLEVLDDPRMVLAGWAEFGTIQGAGAFAVPADKRFYVGGGGSVRAYGHQMAGPVDAAGAPIGGRSSLAFGGELRIRATDKIGVVPFVEAGSAYDTALPDPERQLFWGPGLGLRYLTPFGPVRADIAVPMRRRSGVDDPFQIYVSLGQAF
jgi:translocation and assembly module TamA